MLLLLLKSVACGGFFAFNFYAATQLFYQPQLLPKLGQLLVLGALPLLLHLGLKRLLGPLPLAAMPLLSCLLLVQQLLAGLPSKECRPPQFWPVRLPKERFTGRAFLFTFLSPAFTTLVQTLILFK
jgi:hypothetical protein